MNLFKKILVTLLVSAIALFGFTGVSAQETAGDEPAKTEDTAKSEKKGKKAKKHKHKKKGKKKGKKESKKGKEEGSKSETPAPAEEGAGEEQQ
ncbi:hypothetical protein ACE5IS_06240 [Leptospira wolffii]|uniref:Uncharacterized protein n=1 Tax=Leptospira wolffii TaxID=409998 RepID=A0A2M9ZF52_9LEPT|nr:hypothetical protein [Leptospira wolffii]EPG64825.1 hypothetical protein LEP1GSC061_3002 [Leptospira wolffii serovar Khorat str. Khorat-H2]PJZ67035.1 hypothetical protein CH371_02855 [Leptospira wolffii]TGK62009.1 hypothetical protein EHQ32_03990 [Leptospira wolffii]TGK68610.1 hypothetical protein EHQ27_13430 [Leptospira wolffii]TGK74606.1 hypothetical protein EHQ35_09790 [Leptospira wolffii]